MKGGNIQIGYGRFVLGLFSDWRGVWFDSWFPAWFEGRIRYISLGIGFLTFLAADPVDRRLWWELTRWQSH